MGLQKRHSGLRIPLEKAASLLRRRLLVSIHPQLIPFRDQFPTLELTSENLVQTRGELNRMTLETAAAIEGFDHIDVADRQIDGPAPGQSLRLRLYSSGEGQGLRPCLLWVHGGGYILGCPEMDEQLLCRKANELGCLVVAVDYRLAPEHPYPAALDDCDEALGWILENASALGVNTKTLALGGASAGGGLAAALALRARDRRPGAIAFQCLIYPMLDHRTGTAAAAGADEYWLWGADHNRFAWAAYLGSNDMTHGVSALASPATAKRLDGLPPTYLCIGDQDLFYEENLDYARRLRDSGVTVDLDIVPGAPHGFDKLPVPLAEQAMQRRFRTLGQNFSAHRWSPISEARNQ